MRGEKSTFSRHYPLRNTLVSMLTLRIPYGAVTKIKWRI